MKRLTSGNIWKGVLIALVVPVAGYFLAFAILDVLGRLSDSAGMLTYSSDFSNQTLMLIGLICNLFPFHHYLNRGESRTIRGIVLVTLMYGFIWFFYFRDAIFS